MNTGKTGGLERPAGQGRRRKCTLNTHINRRLTGGKVWGYNTVKTIKKHIDKDTDGQTGGSRAAGAQAPMSLSGFCVR